MRQYGPTSPRNVPEDRNPSTVVGGSSQTAVGGQDLALATYTVPTSRRATLNCQVGGTVAVAFAAGQTATITIHVTPSGGADTIVAGHPFTTATPVNQGFPLGSATIRLKAGDLVTVRVTLGAGAGNLAAVGGLEGTEYDA